MLSIDVSVFRNIQRLQLPRLDPSLGHLPSLGDPVIYPIYDVDRKAVTALLMNRRYVARKAGKGSDTTVWSWEYRHVAATLRVSHTFGPSVAGNVLKLVYGPPSEHVRRPLLDRRQSLSSQNEHERGEIGDANRRSRLESHWLGEEDHKQHVSIKSKERA